MTPTNYVDRPAEFTVTADVVNEGLRPFTITAGAFGNTVFVKDSSGFEPTVYRTRFFAERDDNDRVHVSARALGHYDTWRSGYLDGADARVYRVIDGKMHLVRRDKVANGGTELSGWRQNPDNLLPPETTQFLIKWNDYNRSGTNYFAVFARDGSGNTSPASNVVSVTTPPKAERGNAQASNPTVKFRPKRNSHDTTPPAAPTNVRGSLRDDGVFVLEWDSVADDDLAGYVVAESNTDPARHRGHYLQLEGQARDGRETIRKGDLVIVRTQWLTFDRGLRSDRVGDLWRTTKEFYPDMLPDGFYPNEDPDSTWALRQHTPDTPVEEHGKTYLEMSLGAGVRKELGAYALGGRNGDWYHVPHEATYRVDVWLKADRADAPPVVFNAAGDALPGLKPIAFQPEVQWQRFTAEFPAKPQKTARPTRVFLAFDGAATYSVDNFRIYQADTPYLDYRPYEYERLRQGKMEFFRTHGPIKTGTSTYDMDGFLDAPGLPTGIPKGNSLVQMLRMMKKASIKPWLQIEFHMTPEEWLAFVEYMAAPYDPANDTPEDKPWAYRRVKQGQPRPWVEEFDEIWFELANETWNWLFSPWVFEGMPDHATEEKLNRGRVYGLMQEHVIGLLRSSPYWTDEVEERFTFIIGGWSGSDYGRQAVRGTTSSQFMTIAAYNGGWDEGEGPPRTNPASYFNVLSQINQTAIPRARQHLQEMIEWQAEGFPARLGVYEAGPGYALNGLNGAKVSAGQAAEQERVMKSKLAGTATLDTFLARAYYGFETQNFFTFSEGRTWSSHAKWYRGGQPYPCYRWLEVFNNLALGDMLKVETNSVPTIDTREFRRRKAVEGGPMVAVYATVAGSRVALFCISRKVAGYPAEVGDGYTPVTVTLPFSKTERTTLYRLPGVPSDHNIDANRVKLESRGIPVASFNPRFAVTDATGGSDKGLPPAEAFLYVFEGTDIRTGSTLSPQDVLAQPITWTGPERN